MKRYKVIITCELPAENEIEAQANAQDNCGYYLVKVECEELPPREPKKPQG